MRCAQRKIQCAGRTFNWQGLIMMNLIFRVMLLISMLYWSGAVAFAQATAPFNLQAAIDAAPPGATVSVPPGVYSGALIITKQLHLTGATGPNGERAIIDGAGKGSVLTVHASGTILENLVIRNSGNIIDEEDAGIVVEQAENVQLLGNHLENVLYGVKGSLANGLVLRNNHITGRGLEIGRRGDGIRLWQCEECLIEGNTVESVRDALFWFSDGTIVRNNTFRFNRYGIHMMYTDGMIILDNALHGNSVGAYLMYSTGVLVQGNTFHANRGPSGYGLAMKDIDEITIHENYFLDNRVGLFFDNTPARVDVEHSIMRNVLAYNDTGILMMPAVQRNILRGNTLLDNLEQVGVKGGGSRGVDQLGGNRWDGNYWSDYAGYDAAAAEDRDGIGDLPYRAESLFENIADRHQNLRLFHFSPVEAAVDLAAKAFPVIKPAPKLTDGAPLMAPILPAFVAQVPAVEGSTGWLALGLLLGAALLFSSQLQPALAQLLLLTPFRHSGASTDRYPPTLQQASDALHQLPEPVPSSTTSIYEGHTMISVDNLTKQYPRPGRPWWSDATVTAVDQLSFRLEQGQALALWGINGAGKTTVLKCLLGLLDCTGELHLDGLDLRRDGRRARRLLGYVPQELAFHNDLSVLESCRFYARLKNVAPARIPVVLAQVGLSEQTQKTVGALSGGMKQRLALALALLADPPVLLLDEPTSNLDAATRSDFLDLLAGQRQLGKALLFTSHHVEEVERLADQVLILRDGRLLAQGSPLALMAQLMPERRHPVRHIKVVVAAGQQPAAQQLLHAAGYAASPNGRGLWITVTPERKAEPLSLLYTADIQVLDVEM
jgi:nitrous oxidase accessory protein